MNKFSAAAFAVLVAISLPGATREGAGREKLAVQTDKLSIRLLLNERRKEFANREFPAGQERMKKEMLRDVPHNLSPAEARKHAQFWFRDELQKRYRDEVEKILRSYSVSLTASEMKSFRSGEDAFLEQRFRERFEQEFGKVRKELVEEQRKQLFSKVYPAMEELEKWNDSQLSAILMDRFNQGRKEPLWEENRSFVRQESVEPAIRSGRHQQKLQMLLLQRETVPAAIWDAPAARTYLERELTRRLAVQIPDPAERYPLFPATRKQLTSRAERLPFDRVAAALPRQLPTDEYRKLLQQDPGKHKIFADSLKLVAPGYQQKMLETAFRQSGIPEEFLVLLKKDPAVPQAAARRFRELTPMLQKVRNEFAGEQLKQYWPALAQGKWLPEMRETEEFVQAGAKTIPELKNRPGSASLLRETEEQTGQLLRQAFLQEVRRLELQRKSTDELYDRILREMTGRQTARQTESNWIKRLFTPGSISLDEVIKFYRQEVIAKSSEPLFPLIEKEIKIRSKAILQRVQTPARKPKMEIAKPRTKVTFTLHLSGNADQLTITFNKRKHVFRIRDFSASGIAKEIRDNMAQIKTPSDYRIRIVVDGDRIYYCDVAKIREALKKAFTECELEDSPSR